MTRETRGHYEPEFAWACAWSNGSPRPFIIVHTVGSTRKSAIERFIAGWALNSAEPVMANWRRAYRDGARCIRVGICAWGALDATPTEGQPS